MIYDVTVRVDYTQYLALEGSLKRVKAIYKQTPDGSDMEWIRSHMGDIKGGYVGALLYELYLKDFIHDPVLSKPTFFKACRDVCGVSMKNIRIGGSVRYCFYTPRGEVKIKSRSSKKSR